jgi:hypothetical protein
MTITIYIYCKNFYYRRCLMKKVIVTALTILLGFAGISYSAEFKKGSVELGLNTSISKSSADNGNDYLASTSAFHAGYFVTDKVSVGGAYLLTSSRTTVNGVSTTNSAYNITGQARYHFNYTPEQVPVPYVGAQAGYYDQQSSSGGDGYTYGALGGLKIFMNEYASLNMELNYNNVRVEAGSHTQRHDQTSLLFGFSVFF